MHAVADPGGSLGAQAPPFSPKSISHWSVSGTKEYGSCRVITIHIHGYLFTFTVLYLFMFISLY